MRQTTETNQVSFEKGMIENVKQESFGESLGSCLLLDNYNHTIEIGSVLKRTGEGTYPPTFIEADGYNGNLLTRYKDNPAHELSKIVHSLVMNTANPKINDTFVLLLQNENYPDTRCRIIGFVPYNDAIDNPTAKDTNLVNWRNAHNPTDLISNEYRGWDIKGLYRCSAIYGESLAIGTQPQSVSITDTTNYFPLYIWKLMDLSKKREKGDNFFFNGLIVNDLLNYSQTRIFNVKTPKQAMRNNTFCKIRGFNGYTGQWYNDNEPEGDLTVIVTEEELRYNSFYSFDRWKTTDKFKDVENITGIVFPNPNVNKWYQKGVKVVKSFEVPTFPFVDGIEGRINTNIPADNGMTARTDVPFKAIRKIITTNSGKDLDVVLFDNPNPLASYRLVCRANAEDTINEGNYFKVEDNEQFKGLSGTDINYVKRCLTFAMPDYVSNNEPRCWTKGEKIPLVITANFGGHEVILSKLEYIVNGGEVSLPYGTSFMKWNNHLNSPKVLALRQFFKNGNQTIWIEPLSHESSVPRTSNDDYIKHGNLLYYHYHNNKSNSNDSEFGVGLNYYTDNPPEAPVDFIYPRLVYNTPMQADYVGGDNDTQEHEEVCPKNYNALRISIKLKKAMFDWCIQNECTSIKVYIAKGDIGQKSHLKSVGVLSHQEPPVGLYHKPMSGSYDTQKTDYSMYGLLKEFIIEGEGDVPRQYEDKETFAVSTLLRTNAWQQIGDEYWAVPISDSASGISPRPMPIEWTLENPKLTKTDIEKENAYIKYKENIWDSWGLDAYRTYDKNQVTVNLLADKRWTPDFYIQDYAYNAPTLELNTDGEYWNGLGCDVVSIIKGRAFIANNREQAIVRYSAAQNGVILQDLFNKEDKITVGHETITAMVEFREQLCVFNETSFYRITLPNIFDESTWEFLEAVKGQGTMSPKTICVTPYGFAFLNRNGIWFSQGGESQNIGATIQALYLHLATGVPYIFSHLYNPGKPEINLITRFNNEMEIDYDSSKDELVVSCPIEHDDKRRQEVRLIYNFKTQSWRMESFDFPRWDNDGYKLLYDGTREPYSNTYFNYPQFSNSGFPSLFVDRGKTHFDHNGLMVTRFVQGRYVDNPNTPEDESAIDEVLFEHARQQNDYYVDLWYGWLPRQIVGKIITHEIGDGQNDFILHKILFDAIARDRLVHRFGSPIGGDFHELYGYNDYTYDFNDSPYRDPIVEVELRNQGYITSNTQSRIVDLVSPNMSGKITRSKNLFVSPNNTPFGNVGMEINSSSEAVTLLASMNAKFRRMRIRITSSIVAKIYGIQVQAKAMIRRFQ